MNYFERFLRLLALASGGVLLLLMLYTVADVVLRYGFNRPFSGSWELTEFSMALIVFLAIPYCGWVGGHIAVDLFEKYLDRPGLRFIPPLIAFLGCAVFLLIAWRSAISAIAAIQQVSNMLRIPHYPFRLTVSFCSLLFAIVLFIQGIKLMQARKENPHDA